MPISRLTVTPGKGFDPNVQAHVDIVQRNIEPEHGTGWVVQDYDPASGKLTLTRQGAVTQVSRVDDVDEYKVSLERGTKPADGDRVAARLESDPRHEGYVMIRFEPYLAEATLARMSLPARRCRGAVANALRVKPWDVLVRDRPDGGFDVDLPGGYQPSKHDKALDEVAVSIVGRPGWYLSVDAREHRASIIPGELPTFPATLPYPEHLLGELTTDFTPFGQRLAAPGEDSAPTIG
ncbi:MAG: cell division protein FtsK, partial [Curtobacterium sp.]